MRNFFRAYSSFWSLNNSILLAQIGQLWRNRTAPFVLRELHSLREWPVPAWGHDGSTVDVGRSEIDRLVGSSSKIDD
jgi:hypothetical protein